MTSTAQLKSARPTTEPARRGPRLLASLTGGLRVWVHTWQHPLAGYYRSRVKRRLTPWLGAVGLLLVWGIFLAGTGLATAAYPQATGVTCNVWDCQYPLLQPGSSHDAFFHAYDAVVNAIGFALGCFVPTVGLLIMIVVVAWKSYRGTLNPEPKGLHLATGWANGAVALLALSPLGPAGLVRVRFLDRLYRAWANRALTGIIIGVVATVLVARHVVYPIFWWLGPWPQWGLQLLLVLLWSAVYGVWTLVFAGMSVLTEVTYPSRRQVIRVGLSWQTIASLMTLVMLLIPLLALMLAGQQVYNQSGVIHLAHGAMTILVPVVLLVTGPFIAACLYAVAQVIFRLRLRMTTFG